MFRACTLSLAYSRYAIANLPTVTATVTKVKSRRYKGELITREYVSYTVDGAAYNDIYVAYLRYLREEGDTLLIHYDPANPNLIVAANQEYLSRIIVGIGGIFLLCFSVVQIRGVKQKDAHEQRLLGEGIRVQATVTEVKMVSKKTERHPLVKVTCVYYDSIAMENYTFQSKPFQHTEPDILVGATISVLVDMNNYSEHLVETETLSESKEVTE